MLGALIGLTIITGYGLYRIDCGLTEIAQHLRALRRDGGSEA